MKKGKGGGRSDGGGGRPERKPTRKATPKPVSKSAPKPAPRSARRPANTPRKAAGKSGKGGKAGKSQAGQQPNARRAPPPTTPDVGQESLAFKPLPRPRADTQPDQERGEMANIIEFKLPDIGEGVAEGEITSWKVKPGDALEEDQVMVEVMTDKATVEIGSPARATVVELRAAEGQTVPVGAVIIVLQSGAAVRSAPAHGAPAAPAAAVPPAAPAQRPAAPSAPAPSRPAQPAAQTPAPAPARPAAPPPAGRPAPPAHGAQAAPAAPAAGGRRDELEAVNFALPDIGEGVAEGEVTRWLVKAGDAVTEDQPIVEVMTDKATVEIGSPVDGEVLQLLVKEGQTVPVGATLLVLGARRGAGAAPAPAAPAHGGAARPVEARAASTSSQMMSAAAGEVRPTQAQPQPQPVGAALSDTGLPSHSDGSRRVRAAPATRRFARELGLDIGTLEGSGPNGRVTVHDVRAAVGSVPRAPAQRQAAAAMSTASAPAAPPASRVAPAAPPQPAAPAASPAPRPLHPAQTPAPTPTPRIIPIGPTTPGTPSRRPEPVVREMSRPPVRPVAPAAASAQRPGAPIAPAAPVQPAGVPAGSAPTGPTGGETAAPSVRAPRPHNLPGDRREPLRGLRKRIAVQMRTAKQAAAHFTYVEEIDATELVALRTAAKARGDAAGSKITYMPFLIKAVVPALREFPLLNASLDEETQEVVYHEELNIGVAVETPAGLIVPVVRAAGTKTVLQLAREMAELADRARAGKTKPEDVGGGTFTITNAGNIGGLLATPIINVPEVAIMGVHAIRKKPWVVNDEIVVREIMLLSLSLDHRVVDGAVGARFMNRVKELLENPGLLLFEEG